MIPTSEDSRSDADTWKPHRQKCQATVQQANNDNGLGVEASF